MAINETSFMYSREKQHYAILFFTYYGAPEPWPGLIRVLEGTMQWVSQQCWPSVSGQPLRSSNSETHCKSYLTSLELIYNLHLERLKGGRTKLLGLCVNRNEIQYSSISDDNDSD